MNQGKPKSALNEVIQNWLKNCLDTTEPPPKTTQDLQSDAATFFRYISKNTHVVTESNLVLQTKSSHEEALAQLVKDLGPAFTQEHHRSRLRALFTLVGAIEGCQETQLTNNILKLLGNFLLTHCGPLDDDNYAEDYDTMIRDIAVQGLSALVSTKTKTCAAGADADGELTQSVTIRMDFAMTGISRRCALPDSDEAIDPYGLSGASTNNIRGGLSTLPRSKRAICFDLLHQSVSGILPIFGQLQAPFQNEIVYSNLQVQMVEFARFTASCLEGESDPRCLQQLLKLINFMQIALAPWFDDAHVSVEALFPTEDVFDAVAPYFPIQFTPPPNDIHGITREGLHEALIAVLTFTKMDPGAIKYKHQSMMTLSADLFMETLLPAPEDDNPGPLDKLQALECLDALLFPASNPKAIDLMETRIAVALAQALKVTHDESSLGVRHGGQIGSENKQLADYCRTFVSKVAFQLEQCSNTATWDIVVQKPLQSLSMSLKTSPATSKTSIAYIACLASSGGSRTLRVSLAMGLRPLLDVLEQRMGDDEDSAAAVHGIGAFCASCQAAMSRANDRGVVLHPHPLDVYSEGIAKLFCGIITRDYMSDSMKVGAARGIECLLFAAGPDQVSSATVQDICRVLDTLSEDVLSSHYDAPSRLNVYSLVVGNVIGGVLQKEDDHSETLLRNATIDEFVSQSMYPRFLPTSQMETSDESQSLRVLSIACRQSGAVAGPIMAACLKMFQKSLEEVGVGGDHTAGNAVSFLLQNGGMILSQAFHESSAVDKIFDFLISFAGSKSKRTEDEFKTDLLLAKRVAASLLPAFRAFVPRARLQRLMKMVSDPLPPLSQTDSFQICLWLPFLSEALQHMESVHSKDAKNLIGENESGSLVSELSDVLTSPDFDNQTRSAAGACVYALVSLSSSSQNCPVVPIISKYIIPTLSSTVHASVAANDLKLMALLGTAAAKRGGTSSTTADVVAKFLLEVACQTKAQLPFEQDVGSFFDAANFEDEQMMVVDAASAYGSMLSVAKMKPLMQQRIVYASSKYIKAAYTLERDQAQNGETITKPSPGLLLIVSHVICMSDFAKLDRTMLHQLSTIIVEGLSSSLFQRDSNVSTSVKNIILAAALKVISVAPTVVHGFALSVVTGLLRAYAVSDPTSEISCKLLALQGLEGVARMEGATKASTTSIQSAVVAVLAAAMNHPSGLLRQAAVDVRNAWYVLD